MKKIILYLNFCLLSYTGFTQCLSGVYTIGGNNPNYANMRQAVDALKTVGICGDVIFNIRPGTYPDSLTFTKITGSDTYRIKFKSEKNDSTSVIFKHISSGESYIFQLLSSKNITFEKLTFTLPAVNYASGIKIYSTGGNNEGIELLNNRFLGSNRYCTMIDMYGNNRSTVVTIQNNIFIGESNQVSYKGTDTGITKLKIVKNSFQNAYQGIYAEWADVTISENKMVCTIKQDYPVGIKLTSAWGVIEKNYLRSKTGMLIYGVYDKFTIQNNYLQVDSLHNGKQPGAINLLRSKGATIVFNTIKVKGVVSDDMAVYTNLEEGSCTIKNNIIVNNSNFGGLIFSGSSSNDIDFNRYYTRSTTFGSFAGGNYATFNEWKTASNKDTHSQFQETYFTGDNSYYVSADFDLYNAGTPIAGITTDIENNTRNTSTPDIGAHEFDVAPSDVWPGDADKNNTADNNDLLPIGLYYGLTGSARASISNIWMAHPAPNWGAVQTNSANIKHADCNGDGKIDKNDTLAINLNFNLSHTFTNPNVVRTFQAPTPVYFQTIGTAYKPGDWVIADLYLGNPTQPVTGLYGISFNVLLDPAYVQVGTAVLTFGNSWLCDPANNAITFSKVNPSANTMNSAVTRIDHIPANGYGKIATLKFQLKNTLPANGFSLQVSGYKANDASGNVLVFDPLPVKIDIAAGINELENEAGINVYPNPFTEQTTISYSLQKRSAVEVTLYNSLGQQLQSIVNDEQSPGSYTYPFGAKENNPVTGVYLLKIKINDNVLLRRIVEL